MSLMNPAARRHAAFKVKTLYRSVSLLCFLAFASVGCLFLFSPGTPFVFFNDLSREWGMRPSPVEGAGLFQVLAAGYMYLVTLLAYMMFKHPLSPHFPLLLVNAKGASALLSAALFLIRAPYLIFIANAVTDGTIALGVALIYVWLKKRSA